MEVMNLWCVWYGIANIFLRWRVYFLGLKLNAFIE
jgi:hypothetical protein